MRQAGGFDVEHAVGQPGLLQGLLDGAGGGDLLVLRAAVSHHRHVEGVLGVVDGVVDAQAVFLVGRQLVGQVGDVAVRGGEAGAGADQAPLVGPVQAEVPGAGAAHREAAQHHPAQVEPRAVAHLALDGQEVLQGLVDVGLAGPAVGVVATPEDVDLHPVLVLGGLPVVEAVQEGDLGQGGVAPVQDDVEPPLARRPLAVVVRQRDGVGLEGAVHARAVGADGGHPGPGEPGGLTAGGLAGAEQAAVEGLQRPGGAVLVVELVELDDRLGGLEVDLDVAEEGVLQVLAAELVDGGVEPGGALLDGLAGVGIDGDDRRRGVLGGGRRHRREQDETQRQGRKRAGPVHRGRPRGTAEGRQRF